ncbi:transposase [Candidatus Gottesmanbacteria bacterium]|nr:transposase [Candidatus Gottesmanbacteria bacterium]
MPRGPRIVFENAFFHIFDRGIAKQKIFLEDSDYEKFLKRLAELKNKNHFDHAIFSYVLMPNHFHLLIQTKKTPIAKIMTSLLTSYSMYFNKKYKRVGTLFQNRFKSKLCDKDSYFLGASRYIHLNPVEAGLTNYPKDYIWSSYQELFGESKYNILDRLEVTRLIGETIEGKKRYHQFLLDGIKDLIDLKRSYDFDKDIEGAPRFNTLSQKKYLRRKNKEQH